MLEIPSEFHKVQIIGFTEIDLNQLNKKKFLAINEFIVNYSNGAITFHELQDGKSLVCSYYGKGMIMYPASRIYAMASRNPDVVVTLQDLINETQEKIAQLSLKIAEVNNVIQEAIEATSRTNIAADNARIATENADNATKIALDAASSTIMIYKNPVDTYEEIMTTYPDPENGWRVMVATTGDIFRFNSNNHQWELVDNWTRGLIPMASLIADGLFSKEDYTKLLNMDEQVYDRRVIQIIVKSSPITGKHNVIARFPFNGKIAGIKGVCAIPGDEVTEIAVEKTNDMTNWFKVTEDNLVFEPHSYFDNDTISFVDNEVSEGDLFRLEVIRTAPEIQDITVEIIIDTTKK
ncbi:hypothetical protein EBB07_29615 [Paenibacillaceae bacterium]|nr:hypothetical protein EBB07_29615 [Paenibacillaceae bacterium]